MRKYIILLVIAFVFLLSNAQESDANTNQSTVAGKITSNSVDKAYIGMEIEELLETYKDFEIAEAPLYEFGIHSDNNGVLISKNQVPILFVWKKYGQTTIHGIYCLTEEFETEDGIKVGSTIEDVLKIYEGGINIERNCLDGRDEIIEIPNHKIFLIFLINDKQKAGYYETPECWEQSSQFNLSRKIDMIMI